MTLTARALVRQALLQLGVIDAVRAMTDTEARDGLTALQGWIDTLATHRLTIGRITRAVYTITSGTGSYVLGLTEVAPNWPGPRPGSIEAAAILDTADVEYPLEVLTDARYQAIRDKSAEGWPAGLYWDRAFPAPTVTLWPVPTVATIASAVLYTPVAFEVPTTLDTSLVLPPAAYEAVLYGLVVRCASPYGKPVDATLASLAAETLGSWKRSNDREVLLDLDLALAPRPGLGFDIRRGF